MKKVRVLFCGWTEFKVMYLDEQCIEELRNNPFVVKLEIVDEE